MRGQSIGEWISQGKFELSVINHGSDLAKNITMLPLLILNNKSQDFSTVNVELTNSYADIGAWCYRLLRDSGNYSARNPKTGDSIDMQANRISQRANTAISWQSSRFNTVAHQINEVKDRRGKLSADNRGFWMSYGNDTMEYQSDNYRPYIQRSHILLLGFDKITDADWMAYGFAFNRMTDNAAFNEGSK